MKWIWEKRYALICIYVIGTFVIIYLLKLLLDGAVYFISFIPEFFRGAWSFFIWLAELFAPLIIALVIAYLFDPVVDFFQGSFDKLTVKKPARLYHNPLKTRPYKSRAAGTALTYLSVFLLIGILAGWLTYKLNLRDDYLAGLSAAADKTKNQFTEAYAGFQIRLRELDLLDNLIKYLEQIINSTGLIMQSATDSALNSLSATGGNIIRVLLGIIIAFYLLSGKERIFLGLRKISALFLPYRLRSGVRRVFGDIHSVFYGYIRGQLIDALIMAILISILLSVIGVNFAVIIGIFTGFSNIIPYFGAVLGFLMSVTVALISGEPIKAIYAAVGVIILQQIDAVYINPRVVGKNVKLSPLLVILALSVGGSLYGVLGMIVAVPVCAIVKMFLMRYIEYRSEQAERLSATVENKAE